VKIKLITCTIVLNVLLAQLSLASDFQITVGVSLTTLGVTLKGPEATAMNITMKIDRRAKEAIIAASQDAYAYSQEPRDEVPAILSNAFEIINSACQDEDKKLFQQLTLQQKALMVASIGDQIKSL